MFPLSKKEEKENLIVQRRRLAEEERKKRIFNPKTRQIGMDVNVIGEQVKEKMEAEKKEQEREQFFDTQMLLHSKYGQILERKRNAERKNHLKDMNEFRIKEQKKEFSREYDLNDPDFLKKQMAARISDDDPQLSVSGMQKFDGEDLARKERIIAQRAQLHAWIDQQIEEKYLRQEIDEAERKHWEIKMKEMNNIARELEKQHRLLKLEKEKAVKEYNIEFSIAKKEKELEEMERNELEKLEEIHNMLNNDFLNENLETTFNVNDNRRFKPYHMKSFTADQYEAIQKTREKQLLEKELIKEKESTEKELLAAQERQYYKTRLILERETERVKRRKNAELASINKIQSEEMKEKTRAVNELYSNKVTEDFFSQFGTSSR